MNEKLFILEYQPDEKGCPYSFAEDSDPLEWEWDNQYPRPHDLNITKKYSSKIIDRDIKFIDFDFYGLDSKYVSNIFIELCKDCDVNFRPIPLDLVLHNRTRPKKSYFIFLPGDHLAILDNTKSIVDPELVVETGKPMTRRFFPEVPIYKKIEKFIPKNILLPNLFQCVELGSLVCTDKFRAQAIARNIRGVQFTPLDENYIYDPWDNW
jgi:hypothetical protein